MTAPNIVVEGGTYALTHRCLLRKMLLTPMTPVVHGGILYLLGRALQETGGRLHHVTVMPNHGHVTITIEQANLPDFKRLFFGEVGKFVKVALAEHGYEPPERIFAEGKGHHMRLVNAAAQLTWLHYEDVNTVSAGLVECVEHYPGLSTDPGLMNGGVLVVDKPPFYVGRGRARQIEIPGSVPPVLEAALGAERAVYHLRRARRHKEKALAGARKRPVLGPLSVTRVHPWSEPRSPRRIDTGPKPSFMVVDDEPLRIQCALETRAFRERHERARQARRAGEPAVFPYGTYEMRVRHGAPVEDVSSLNGAVVNAPGPLGRPRTSAPREDRRALTRRLAAAAAELRERELEDTLEERLADGRADEVDRRDVHHVEEAPERDGDAPSRPSARKRVVLRGATATAKRRRQRIQLARSRSIAFDDELHGDDPADVEPPFD